MLMMSLLPAQTDNYNNWYGGYMEPQPCAYCVARNSKLGFLG